MVDSDEGSENGSENEDGSSAPSSTTDSSRFDEFHRRLDDRDSKRDRSGEDTSAEERPDTRPAIESEPSEREEAAESDRDWVWGPSKGTELADERETPDNGSVPLSEKSGSDPTGPDSDDDRVWNEGGIDRLDVGTDGDDDPPDEPDGRDRTKADPSPESEASMGTAETDPSSEAHEEADERTEPIERNRWAELGSDIRGGGESSDVDKTVELADLDAESGGTDRETTIEEDEQEWIDGDPTGGPSADNSQLSGPGFSDRSLSNEVDRAVSEDSVLVLGPTGHSVSDVICSKFLTGEEGSRDVIFVTFGESSSERIDVCHRADEWVGGEIGVIEVGRGGRQTAASEVTGGKVGSITVRHVSNPGDLSKLGIVITQLLSEFSATPRRTVLCVHTLSALHNHVGTKTLFRFLNTLQGRLRSEDAVGHYHMDPELHDEIVIETLRSVFDSVVRFSADGELTVE